MKKITLGCSQCTRGEAGQGLSNQQQAQSAEAEKQCASSSDKLHKPQKGPELIQSTLHQGIIQGRFDDQLYFPCREMLFFENLNNFNAEIYTQIDCSCAARTNHTAGLMQKPNTSTYFREFLLGHTDLLLLSHR